MKKYFLGGLLTALLIFCVAAKPNGISQLTSLWIGDATDTADTTPGVNDLFVSGTAEIDGVTRLDGGTTLPAGDISAADIADPTRSFNLPLVGATLNGTGVIGNDGATAPGIATGGTDSVPSIVYADSSETASVGWSLMAPPDYSSSLSWRIMVSTSSNDSYASLGFDWATVVNNADGSFGSPSPQTAVFNTNTTPSTSNVFLTFTPDSGTLALISGGTNVSVWFWNADGRSGAAKTTEIKNNEARYTATQ